MFFALTVSKGIADLTNPDVSMVQSAYGLYPELCKAVPGAGLSCTMKTARIRSTNRASRIGGTTRQEDRAGE